GGAEAISAVDAYRQEGMLVAHNGGGHGTVTRIARDVDALSVLVEYPGRPEIRIVEGERGWRGNSAAELEEVRGPLYLAMVAQAARAWVPMILVDFRDSIAEAEPEGELRVLVLPLGESVRLRLLVDPDTGYVVRSESVLVGMPPAIGFATDYADFRPVDGVVFAFREETFASGVHTASLVVGTMEINPTGDRARLPMIR
ncbi:MAG TPA: hypothetical protein VLA43_08610, partial [Longimicrobiales bacterium]|nr:hypothetical protein [Longimicrobiales bacterium]